MNKQAITSVCYAYHDIRRLLSAPISGPTMPEEYRADLCKMLTHLEWECRDFCQGHELLRWSETIVGPVLAAAIWASLDIDRVTPSATSLMRIFGLAGQRPLSAYRAWDIVRRYIHEPVLSPQAVGKILRSSGLSTLVLPASPAPIDMLVALTKFSQSELHTWVGRWLVNYFRDNADKPGEFHDKYRSSLANIEEANDRGDIGASIDKLAGHPDRAGWEELLCGRLPKIWLENRAGQAASRDFLAAFWERWAMPKQRQLVSNG